MSISYHGVVGFKQKATLPSVETWGENMNILRDPPKSIHTRKIDKVGETSEITQMIQESGDRACEAIMTYARGVNPMVAVSYNNYGNNGGRSIYRSSGGKQAFLPYRVMNEGAFRPPVQDLRSQYALSRLPRVWTSSFTQPGFADFSKKMMCPSPDDEFKGVKTSQQMLHSYARPTAVYKMELPTEPIDVKYVIKNPMIIEGFSGYSSNKKINAEQGDVYTGIIDNPMHYQTQSNKSIQHQTTPISEIYNIDPKLKENMNISYTAPSTGYEKNDYIHEDMNLERSLPYYSSHTNIGQNIHKNVVEAVSEREYTPNRPHAYGTTNIGSLQYGSVDNISSREYSLRDTVNAGSYVPNVGVPKITREGEITEFDNERVKMRERIYNMQMERFSDNNNRPPFQI